MCSVYDPFLSSYGSVDFDQWCRLGEEYSIWIVGGNLQRRQADTRGIVDSLDRWYSNRN